MFDYGYKEGFLEDGSVVAFPTDTVFGLGCRLYDNKALNRMYEIKNRELSKQIPVLCDSLVCVNEVAIIDSRVLTLAHKFWPGPLTMILPASDKFQKHTESTSVGVRIPNNSLALRLIKQNGPMWVTSLNLSGEKDLTDINEVVKQFGNKVDYIFKEHHIKYLEVSSTIIDLTGEEIKYIRIGTITKEEIVNALK